MDADTLRIIDANLNRAREALRVIEDHARFALDDADAAERVKTCRHDLRLIVDAIGPEALLAARDIVSDVGRDVKISSELRRESGEDVVRAAFARLTEATCVVGEFAKLLSQAAADDAERIRYAAYELEQRIVLRGTLRARFRDTRLYVIITEALCRRNWLETADAAIQGGAGCLQLREQELPDAELLRRARELRRLVRRHNVLMIVNDRPDIARLASADGVHLGQDDLSVREARRVGGAQLLVGKSTHTLEQVEAAIGEQPDYIAVGPMFPSATKPQKHIADPETLRQAVPRTRVPLVAIGGIEAKSAESLFDCGASCVCVCSAVIGADDPRAAARSFASSGEGDTRQGTKRAADGSAL